MPLSYGSITNESYIPPLKIHSLAPCPSIVFRPPPPVSVIDDEETNRRDRDAPEAKQKKESDKRKEMGLTCMPTRKYVRKKLPHVPVKALLTQRRLAQLVRLWLQYRTISLRAKIAHLLLRL